MTSCRCGLRCVSVGFVLFLVSFVHVCSCNGFSVSIKKCIGGGNIIGCEKKEGELPPKGSNMLMHKICDSPNGVVKKFLNVVELSLVN